MSLDTPQIKRALDEVEFLRARLFHLQEQTASLHGRKAKEVMVDYLHTLYALVDKEHNLYTRFSLMDSVESHIAILNLDAYKMMDLIGEIEKDSLSRVYPEMKKNLLDVIKDATGEDFDIDDFQDDFNIW